MKKSPIFGYLLLLLMVCATLSQNPEPAQTVLEINKLLNVSFVQSGYTYYSVNFQLQKDQAKLLMITVETEQRDSIAIFTSMQHDGVQKYYKYPNFQNNSNSCSYSSLDTCALALPEVKQGEAKNITVYIGVQIFESNKMTILVELEDIYPAKIGIKYDIDFHVWESGVFTLSAEDVNQYQQIIVQMQYGEFKDVGRFAIYAGVDEIPNKYENRIQSLYMGAFTQILVLDPIDQNSTYFIVLEGERGTEFDVTFKPFSTSSPKLYMNETIFYYSSALSETQHMAFSMSIDYASEEEVLPLFLDMNSLGGYGEFQIDYCDGLTNFTFTNINGESGEVVIPIAERKECYGMISSQGGLMIENLIVTIKNVAWYFSYSIGVFEGKFPLMISPYSEKLGTLVAKEDVRVYEMEGYINQSFMLKYKTITGEKELNFTIYECRTLLLNLERCVKILNSFENGTVDTASPQYSHLNYTCKQKLVYKLQVTHGSMEKFDSEYVLLLLPINQKPTILSPSRPVYSIISKNQYHYYIINLTQIQKQSNITIDNKTAVVISMIETNGDCMLFTSLTEKNPTYDQVFEKDSQVDYSWSGKKMYQVNKDTEAIYVGVLGSRQSLYHLQVSIQTNEEIPESYTRLVSDKILSFELSSSLNQDHILLTYTAHSIPYSVIVSPAPGCVAYSYSLPFANTSCRELPSQITEKVIYLKIFKNSSAAKEDDQEYKFIVYVYSGSHYLFEWSPVLIACIDSCYEYVTVFVPEKIRIVHKGMGYVALKDSNETYSNEKMEILCEKSYPCFLTINASLPWGGDMQLFYDSADIQEIEWMTKPLTFQQIYDPKHFYMEIHDWNSINTAIFYTEGISLTIYYNIYSLRENATNALEYGFPNSYSYMRKSTGNPLRRFHIVEFDEDLIKELGCRDENDLCIATLSVFANTNTDYSTPYINKSIGYYSCNTYRYYIPMNSPYLLSEEYSLIYFIHEMNEDQIYNKSSQFYVKVQPLSSCRPQIYAPFSPNKENDTYDKDMPFYGFYKITSDPKDPDIQFSISTDTPCQYMVWLLDSNIQPVMENANYELTSDQNGTILFAYSDKYLWNDKKFTVAFDTKMTEIMIDKYEKLPNGSLKIPTISTSLAYITQSNKLEFIDPDIIQNLYLIKASTNPNTKVNVKVASFEDDTIIMTNQQQKFTFNSKKSKATFRYYSNMDFLLFVTTDSGKVQLTVTDYKRDSERKVLDTIIDQKSNPWITIKAVAGDIRQYEITLENILLTNDSNRRNLQQVTDAGYPKITLHIEETGTIGLPQLYDGVALFDAFYTEDSQNCYKYVTEPIVGRPSLTVDLIFGSELINNVPEIRSRVLIENGEKVNSTWTKLPTGYRLQTEFYGNQVFEFCFSINEKPTLVSKQFYVMVENIEYSLRHLTIDTPLSSDNPGLYEIFQYVATEKQNLMIEVVNCYGKPTLLGAKQYSDIYMGQVSELGSFYRDDTMSIAMAKIDMGYYYFALKLDDIDNRYKIRVQLFKESQKLHYDKFELQQKLISKVRAIQENGKSKVRVHLPKVTFLNLPQDVKVHHVTYNLLVDNLREKQNYSSNVIAKCPVLANRNMSSYKFTQNMISTTKVEGDSSDDVRIDIPTAEVPQYFNLTGFVEVSISEPYAQTLTYYYDSKSFILKDTYESSKGTSAFAIVFVIAIIIGSLVVLYIVYRRWREQKRNSKVQFEMANYEGQNQTNYTEKEQELTVANEASPSKALKKALNQNTGYGQFIDETV